MATRKQLLAQIADLKEQRNQTILANAPENNVAAGQGHPDVQAIEEQIKALRDEVAALDEEE